MALLSDVWLKKPKFSNFDLSRRNRFTAAPGVLYPVMVEEMLPGDTAHIDVQALVKTYPLFSPLLGSFKQQIAFFFVPTRLYVQSMDINRLKFDPSTIRFPYFNLKGVVQGDPKSEVDVQDVVKHSTILDHMGIASGSAPVLSVAGRSENLNAIPLIGYYDIFRNYYANTQEDNWYMFSTVKPTLPSDDSVVELVPFTLTSLDEFIYYFVQNEGANFIQGWDQEIISDSSSAILNPVDASQRVNFGGLCVATHRPDLFTNWLAKGTYDDMVKSSQINVVDGTFTINQLRFGNHLMKYYERGLVAGGRYDDWVEAQFGVKTNRNLCIPELLHVITSDVVFEEVVSTSNASASTSSQLSGLGDLGGRGRGFMRGRKLHFVSSENGYLIAIYHLTPNVSYDQGIKPFFFKTEYLDLYSPAMDRIGFQPLPAKWLNSQVNYSTNGSAPVVAMTSGWTSGSNQMSIGYQPAWIEYMTATDEVHGDFSNVDGDLPYWVITRDFGKYTEWFSEPGVSGGFAQTAVNASSYVVPDQFEYPFVNQALNAENFLIQLGFDFVCRRAKGKQQMPSM